MSIFHLEITKILKRKTSLFLLLGTILLFPSIIATISYVGAVRDDVPEGLFPNQVASLILTFSQSYFFLPVWIIVFVGQEFSTGHVNRIVFTCSRDYYYQAKLLYCALITILFSLMSGITYLISITTGPFESLSLDAAVFLGFVLQTALSTFAFTTVLLFFVFLVRSPLVAFVTYFVWGLVESVLYTLFKGLYDIELFWLPLHLVRTFYVKNGEAKIDAYYNPLVESPLTLIAPIVFVVIMVFLGKRVFLHRDLKPLSD